MNWDMKISEEKFQVLLIYTLRDFSNATTINIYIGVRGNVGRYEIEKL